MLLYLLLIIAVMAVSGVVITKFTFWMIGKMGHDYLTNTHRSAEFISKTGKLPPFWFNKKRYRYFSSLILKFLALRKLKKIIAYFSRSPVAADDEARKIVVPRLTEVYNDWVDREWESMKGN